MAKPSRKRSVPNCSGVVTKDMAKNITTAQQSVASRIREVPMRSPNLPSRGPEIERRHAGHRGNHPRQKGDIVAVRRHRFDKQRQDRAN